MLDAVQYGLKVYRQSVGANERLLPIKSDWRTFALGYSQGGAVTLALQRLIEEKGLAEALHFQGSICGDGPYDLISTIRYYFDDDGTSYDTETEHRKEIITMPVVMPLIIKGMGYGNPLLKPYNIEQYLSQQFRDTGVLEWIDSKEYSTTDINGMWHNQLKEGMDKDDRHYTPEQMAENSLATGWTPRHRIYFMHSKGDMIVPYGNLLAFRAAHADQEGTLFLVNDTYSSSDHVDTGSTFYMSLAFRELAPAFNWICEPITK